MYACGLLVYTSAATGVSSTVSLPAVALCPPQHPPCLPVSLSLSLSLSPSLSPSAMCFYNPLEVLRGLQTYPNLHPPLRVGPPLGCLPRGGANLCRFVPVRSLQTRASGREFVHVCFGLLGPLVQVGANSVRGPRMGGWIRRG